MVDELLKRIIEEENNYKYSIHPGYTSMYHNVRQVYLWKVMKEGIAEFVDKCLNCQKVRMEHKGPGGLAQNINIQEQKWEMINMDFIMGVPRSLKNNKII